MTSSILFATEITSIAEHVLAQLEQIAPASRKYNAELHNAMELTSFRSDEQKKIKAKISPLYFQFGISIKDILCYTDQTILPLTDIMKKADFAYSVETIDVCHQILEAYMQLQSNVAEFSTQTEDLISLSEQVPLTELSVVLQRLLIRVNQAQTAIRNTITVLAC